MSLVESTTLIPAPVQQVWETLADVGSIADWHPGVAQSPVFSANRTGLGAARRIEMYDGNTAVETVTALEEGRAVAVTMSEHKMPMSRGVATFVVEADADGTRVTMSMDYDMKFGPAGWLLDALLLRRVMKKLIPSVLDGLRHHLTTGEVIPEGWQRNA